MLFGVEVKVKILEAYVLVYGIDHFVIASVFVGLRHLCVGIGHAYLAVSSGIIHLDVGIGRTVGIYGVLGVFGIVIVTVRVGIHKEFVRSATIVLGLIIPERR